MKLPKKVAIRECITREGIQPEEVFIPTEAKIWLIDRLSAAGFPSIEVTNLLPSQYNLQFSDAEEVLQKIKRKEGTEYFAASLGASALERAIGACQKGYGPTAIGGVVAASDYYCQHNLGANAEELLKLISEWHKMASDVGLGYGVGIMTAWGYPIDGLIPLDKTLSLAEKLVRIGVDSLSYADTTGEGTPDRVYELFSRSKRSFPDVKHGAHFHDLRGWGIANCVAALEAGAERIDTSIGGVGGQMANILNKVPIPGIANHEKPSDLGGNICAEDLLVMLERMGIATGINVDAVMEIGKVTERILERKLRSRCLRTEDPLNRIGERLNRVISR